MGSLGVENVVILSGTCFRPSELISGGFILGILEIHLSCFASSQSPLGLSSDLISTRTARADVEILPSSISIGMNEPKGVEPLDGISAFGPDTDDRRQPIPISECLSTSFGVYMLCFTRVNCL
jgi:hypothetical protein